MYVSQERGACRLYSLGSKLSEGAVMAADASLSLECIAQAMHAMFEMLSEPDVLPEFNSLQVITRHWPSLSAKLCIAEFWSILHANFRHIILYA